MNRVMLSSVLSSLHALGANVLTVNQNIPVDGVTTVTISIKLNNGDETLIVKDILSNLHGIVEIKMISGE